MIFFVIFSLALAIKSDYRLSCCKTFVNYFSKKYAFFAVAWMPPLSTFTKFRVFIAHNVPAVYDVFAAAIKERGAFQQPQKCGWRLAWEWSAAE
jgi:hypothetical protein